MTSTYTSTPENTACNKQTSEKTTTAVLKKSTWQQQKNYSGSNDKEPGQN